MTKAKGPGGAPAFVWTEEIEDEIFDRILDGEAVSQILSPERDDGLPSERTFWRRTVSDDEFWRKYARTKQAMGHREFDRTWEIASNTTPETVAADRLKVDTLKWRAGKLAPKVYGDKQEIDHTSSDGSMTPTRIELVAPKRNDDSSD